jgi:uncharacterized protein (DUF2235 family)
MRLLFLTAILWIFAAVPSQLSAKTIVILMDGTWNEPEYEMETGKMDQTNIERLRDQLVHNSEQKVYYLRGVGTDGKTLKRVRDGAFGTGAEAKVDEAYGILETSYKDGDRIAIFGFSRGAATSRLLARRIAAMKVNDKTPNVQFLGLFDTVTAFGVPEPDWDWDGFKKRFHEQSEDFAIPANVKRVVHLVSIDEDRAAFMPTLLQLDSRSETVAEEVWFAGNHGDIGGGWAREKEDGTGHALWQITFRFMVERTRMAQLGLRFRKNADGTEAWESLASNPSAKGRVHRIKRSDPTKILGGVVHRQIESNVGTIPQVHISVRKMYNDAARRPSYRPEQFDGGFDAVNAVEIPLLAQEPASRDE